MKIIKLSATHSTNDYLKSLQKEVPLEDGTIVWTRAQTKGRGQQGASWYMEPDESLAFSMFRRNNTLQVQRQFDLTLAVSIAVRNVVNEFGLKDVFIKWPNDIMAGDKKLCGILIENQLSGTKIKSSVIGVGLNVNNRVLPNLPKATSMRIATGETFSLDSVFEKLVAAISSEMDSLKSISSNELRQRYESFLFRRGKISVFEDLQGRRFNGMIQGISSEGELVVLYEGDRLQKFQMKEIKLLF